MELPLSFLILEENDVMRSLLARVLMRRFPPALVQQCAAREAALFAAKVHRLTTIIVGELPGAGAALQAVRELRRTTGETPILLLSGHLAREMALEAGATYVIDPQNWIRVPDIVGTIVRLGLRHNEASEVELRQIA